MSSLNLDQMYGKMGGIVDNMESQLTSQMQNLDPSDSKSMVQMQVAMQKWTLCTQMQSNTLKSVSEGIKNTVSNIR